MVHAKKFCGFPGGSVVKDLPAIAEDTGDKDSIPGWGRSPGGGKDDHCSILVWKIPCTEEPGGLQSMEWQRFGQDLVTQHSYMGTSVHFCTWASGI